MKKLSTIVAVMLFAVTLNAQQWDGSSNSTDHIHRYGNVTIGAANEIEKLTVHGNLQLFNGDGNMDFPKTYIKPTTISFGYQRVGRNTNIRYYPLFEIHNYNDDYPIINPPLGGIPHPYGLYIHPGFDRQDPNIPSGTVPDDKVAFFVSNNKKIGIGTNKLDCTNCTDYRLFVKDGIKTEKVKVEIAASNGWADYVFKEDYPLMPLNELDQFIKTNGHLPEVPTTEEAIANGIELKEMNILLLKKIEELTLYTIEQQKRIEALEKTVNLLNK